MAEALRLFILAGEPSGDRIAADLVRRLKGRMQLDVEGVGGEALGAEGLNSLYPMSDLSVMGISDVVKRLPLLLFRVAHTARAIWSKRPDIVVLVDAQVFSQLVAMLLRRLGYRKPILLYVAPSVWARAPERAAKLRTLFDEVLAVLPFEPEAMARLGGPPTRYVGHPALGDRTLPRQNGRRIALLPGSRGGELRRHLPMFRAVAEQLAAKHPDLSFFLPTLRGLAPSLEAEVATWPLAVEIVTDGDMRRARYAEAAMAVCCAGTATLELALAELPMVVTYVMDEQQVAGFARLGRPRVGLPNIILGEDVTPELVLAAPDAAQVVAAALPLIDDRVVSDRQVQAFRRLRTMMEQGAPDAPRHDPADVVLDHLPPVRR